LVRKWNALGHTEVTTTNQWLQACYQTERLIEAAKLQHVATTVPIMVLSLLQANSSGIPKEAHSSSFAHYFYFLIIGALGSAGVTASNLNRYLALGTHLSWFVKNNGTDLEISEAQFENFCQEYSRKWTKTDANEAKDTLVRARILDRHADLLCFSYQYTYYYFLGRYTSLSIDDNDVKAYIEYCVGNLYVRECANTLLFLAHHSSNSYVIDKVITALESHFAGVVPVTFSSEDVKVVSNLISGAPALAYQSKSPAEARTEFHRVQDDMDTGHDGLADAPSPPHQQRTFIEEIVSLAKTMEVAGALLTNHFASLSREKKNASIQRIFDAALRLIRNFFSVVENDPERLMQEIASRLRSRKRDLLSSDAEIEARYAVAWLIRIISASWVMKAGQHVNSSDLIDNVDEVVNETESVALRLIRISQLLDGTGRLPKAALNEVIRREKANPCVMSVLQLLVLNRLYMYETHHEDKHWAISTFDLAENKKRLDAVDRRLRLEDSRRVRDR
jgi:hypothetical protein